MSNSDQERLLKEVERILWGILNKGGAWSRLDRSTKEDCAAAGIQAAYRAIPRMRGEYLPYLVSCAVGGARHYLRDHFSIIRVPAWVAERKKSSRFEFLPLDNSLFNRQDIPGSDGHCMSLAIEEAINSLKGVRRQVAHLLAQGYTQSEISSKLGLSESLVNYYVARIRESVRTQVFES